MDADTQMPAQPRRHWFRFSLRTLLILVTLLSVPLGWVGWKMGQERATITWVEKMGGKVYFRSILKPDDRSWWEESTDKWFGERVRSVDLTNNQVSDLSPLAELKSLNRLNLSVYQVSDLSPLAELKSLTELSVGSNQVSDLSPLADLKSLTVLRLGSTKVIDLSPLAELKNLRELHLTNTQVSDLSPLAELKNFKELHLFNIYETEWSREQKQELRQALPNCHISYRFFFLKNDQRSRQHRTQRLRPSRNLLGNEPTAGLVSWAADSLPVYDGERAGLNGPAGLLPKSCMTYWHSPTYSRY